MKQVCIAMLVAVTLTVVTSSQGDTVRSSGGEPLVDCGNDKTCGPCFFSDFIYWCCPRDRLCGTRAYTCDDGREPLVQERFTAGRNRSALRDSAKSHAPKCPGEERSKFGATVSVVERRQGGRGLPRCPGWSADPGTRPDPG